MALSPCFPKIMHLLFLLSYALVIFNAPVHADPPYNYCRDANDGAEKAIFRNNEQNLLLSLSSNASVNKFYNASAGDYPSKAYGLFLCINYVSHQDCYNCIATASQAIAERCPSSTDATVWEELCQLRVSDQNFFGRLSITCNISRYNPEKVSNSKRFRSIVNSTLLEITEVAAFNSSAHMYATKQVAFSDKDNIYSLVQCTPDLSPEDCNLCLQAAIVEVLAGYQYRGARLLSCSCYLRYEFYDFYAGQIKASMSSESSAGKNNQVKKLVILLAVTGLAFVLAAVLLRFYVCFFSTRKRMKGVNGTVQEIQMRDAVKTKEISSFLHHKFGGEENPFFDLATMWTATDYFSDANKLGEGGFGPVYKGTLIDGTPVAVKRLSVSSEHGIDEFTNEVLLIMKLQHKNLVKLLGFCVHGDERLLVYEFLPNKGLDYFLYDPWRRAQLNWNTRLNIVNGIARGILYLHEDSRLRIVHRDLKPSNVLLDSDMNPKISDFGIARIYGDSEGETNTSKVVGTYGYMAPEYAMEGIYSIKSDIFSFGIILLEILTGRKGIGFHLSGNGPSLQAYAWQMWSQDKGLELMDHLLIDDDSCRPDDFLRCVHIGLLCVQEDAFERPTMSSVMNMLKSETVVFGPPKRPAFSVGRFTDHYEPSFPDVLCENSTVSDFSAQ